MRISDWSSDVCSSDLPRPNRRMAAPMSDQFTPAQQHADAPLRLFNSLTRAVEPFAPIQPNHARVYSCGPTVYNYAHLGNLRAYVFTDTLRRTLLWKGLDVTDRKSTRLNSSHYCAPRMPSSA